MKTKQLGPLELPVPEIGMGTHRYTGGEATLRAGIQCGASLIDTAESYGTEDVVGKAVTGIRHRVIIATKVAATHFRYQDLLDAADRSLKALNTDYIDIYQLHRFNPDVPLEETLGGMEALADAGKIRYIGVCNFSVAQMKRAQAALAKHRIVTNQVDFSLITRNVERGLFPYCRENQITIIAHSPLGRGLENIKRRDRNGALSQLAAATGHSEAQVALNWCVEQKNLIAVPKANSAARVLGNCGASGWSLSQEQVAFLEKSVKPFRRRGPTEVALRRVARRVLNRVRGTTHS